MALMVGVKMLDYSHNESCDLVVLCHVRAAG